MTRKFHNNGPGNQDIAINLNGHVQDGNVTSEMRERTAGITQGGITELRVSFDLPLVTAGGTNPVTILEQEGRGTCLSPRSYGMQAAYEPYTGMAAVSSSLADGGSTLVLSFVPGLENARTYRLRINTAVTRVAGQKFEVRCLKADVNNDGRVNATDRSLVVSVWTGSGYSAQTDFDLNGVTNTLDRSLVVAMWTDQTGMNCAP